MKARRLVLPAALPLPRLTLLGAGYFRPHSSRGPGTAELADLLGNVRQPAIHALNQIRVNNVGNLELQWVFQARSLEKFEATPLVVDGVMYTVQAPNDVVALDAATGRILDLAV